MNEPHDPDQTADLSSPPDSALDAGLAAAFGQPRCGPVLKPQSDAMPAPEEVGDRYQLSGEIARGGMGAVLRGRDTHLGRDLAVKVLLPRHADQPDIARRFLEEAQIGGQLQHPGVVPVYDLGRFGDRPFFTMKLVKGRTLAALLAERSEPSEDRPRLLDIALKVAQALAYAHAHGVIHRDLKPANVMVGAFGEVQVMDWGLAKVLAEGGVADEEGAVSRERQRPEDATAIRTVRSGSAGSGTDTEAGSLLGTLAYMPPEQANGDVALLDRRADVFGLGAILCEVLTGQPPYVGRSPEEVRRKAANGDLANAHARLDACGADAELVSLTRACLSPEAIDRLRDAQAVAEALTGYLDSVQARLHQAELAGAEARARAVEEGKRQRLTVALAATVLLTLTVGGSGWLWIKAEHDDRLAHVTRDVNDALTRATALRAQAQATTVGSAALFAQAREQAQRALALVENSPADAALAARVKQLQAELDEDEKDWRLLAALDAARLAQAETVVDESRFAKERAVPLFREAFVAYGLAAGQGEPAAAAARLGQRPAAVRQAAVAALQEWTDLAADPGLGLAEPHLDWLRAVAGATEPDQGWMRDLRAALNEMEPAKRRAALEKLAREADVEKMPVRALTRLTARLDAVEGQASAAGLLRRAQQRFPADFWVNHGLGMALRALPGEGEEAVRYLTAAVALRPDSPGVHLNLGNALKANGQLEEAIACYRQAIELDPKYAAANYSLGLALNARGQLEEAVAWCRKAVALDPRDARAHNNLGTALSAKGQLEEAIACYRQAIAIDSQYAFAHANLGHALQAKGQLDEAVACYRLAIGIDPKLARIHNSLGAILCDVKHDYDGAVTCFRKAVALDPKDAPAHYNLGNALSAKGHLEEAIACYRQAIALDPKDAAAHTDLGLALQAKGQLNEAIASHRQAIVLDPKLARAHSNLGGALQVKGQVEEAITCFRQAIKLDPKLARRHHNLGIALAEKGQLDEAIACYRQAIDLDPKDALVHNNLGLALASKGQLDKAIACFRRAIALDPKDATAHTNLGLALQAKGQLNEAIASHRQAIALDPKLATAHLNLGVALDAKGRVEEAIACYRQAIALDPKDANPHGALAKALLHQGRFAEARDTSARALELLPEKHSLRAVSSQQVQQCIRLIQLETRLPGLLRGEDRPASARESLELAMLCQLKRQHAAATRFFAEAFASDAKLAGDLAAAPRYNAACSAARAATGRGDDAAQLDDKARSRLRQQARAWLRADLAGWQKQLQGAGPREVEQVRAVLRHWQQDADLASIRDPAALARLSEEERAAFTQLWADVAALLTKAEIPAQKEDER
jgi:serine/threonine-protein kinase